MKKNKIVKIIIFIIIFLALIVGGIIAFYYIRGDENPFQNIIDNFTKPEEKINDTKNGVYVYKEDLNGSKFIYSGCSLNSIDYYVLVVNDNYYSFKSSCMGTYPIEEGKTEKLDIKENENNTSYVLTYLDHEYTKNDRINTIETNNTIATKLKNIDLANYELILNETEFEGNYYDILAKINGISSNLSFRFNVLEDKTYKLSIHNGFSSNDEAIYEYSFKDYNNLPIFYPYGKNIVVIERGVNSNKLAYKIKSIGVDGINYDLDKMLPIKVDNVTLDDNKSIYVTYDSSTRNFRMLIGNNDKMCVENSSSTNIAYYEFKIVYNSSTGSFSVPEFVKYGRENEGCSYVDRIMGR